MITPEVPAMVTGSPSLAATAVTILSLLGGALWRRLSGHRC